MEIIDIPNEQFNLAGREAAFCSSCLCDIQDDSGNGQAGGESSPRGRGCRTPGDALPLQGCILTPRPALGAGSWICRVAAAVSRESRSFSSSPPAEGGPWGSAGHTLLGIHFFLCSVQEGLSSQRSGLCSATAGAGTGSCAGGTRFQATVLTAGALPAAVSQMCSAHWGCTKGHFLHQGRSTGMAAPQQGGTVQLRGVFVTFLLLVPAQNTNQAGMRAMPLLQKLCSPGTPPTLPCSRWAHASLFSFLIICSSLFLGKKKIKREKTSPIYTCQQPAVS